MMGFYMSGCGSRRDIPRFIALYQRGKLPSEKLRMGTPSFDEINDGFDRLSDGSVLRKIPRARA